MNEHAASPVVLEPEKMSKIVSLFSVRYLMKKSGIFLGNLAGLGSAPAIRQFLK